MTESTTLTRVKVMPADVAALPLSEPGPVLHLSFRGALAQQVPNGLLLLGRRPVELAANRRTPCVLPDPPGDHRQPEWLSPHREIDPPDVMRLHRATHVHGEADLREIDELTVGGEQAVRRVQEQPHARTELHRALR